MPVLGAKENSSIALVVLAVCRSCAVTSAIAFTRIGKTYWINRVRSD